MLYAVKELIDDDVEFVVTIDSDTALQPDALVRVVEPLKVEGLRLLFWETRVSSKTALPRGQPRSTSSPPAARA